MEHAAERDITSSHVTPQADAGVTISVEALVWFALVAVAALLRFVELGSLPLTTDEAARALDASRVAGGDVPETWRGDLAEAATSYLFRIFGEHEVVARVLPAAAGTALIAVLWFAREQAGRVGALTAATLVVFSPLFIVYSRSATAFSLGTLAAVVLVVCLFGYLRSPRTGAAFLLVVALALAPLTDAVAVVAALSVAVFLVVEALVFRNEDVSRAWVTFLRSPLQWVSGLLVLSAAVQLGVTHFGTSIDASLPGLRLWADMFEMPRDSRAPEFDLALLLGYDWPLLLAGSAGFMLLAARLAGRARHSVTPFQRFLLVWTLLAALTLTLVTRREAGQLLLVLLPLALLAGSLVEEIVGNIDWRVLMKWQPAAAVILTVLSVAAILMTEWSSGRAEASQRLLLIASPLAAAGVIGVLCVRSRAGAGYAVGATVVVMAAAFLAHSSLAVAFEDGTEFAVDLRLQPRAERLRETVDRLAAERGGTIAVDGDLLDELGWTLRDSPVVFGGPAEGATVVVSRPDAAPPGFAGLTEVWRVSEGWYPDEVLAPRRMWRWLLYREPYGDVEALEVRIYVRTI